jgi:hypothetical protein
MQLLSEITPNLCDITCYMDSAPISHMLGLRKEKVITENKSK